MTALKIPRFLCRRSRGAPSSKLEQTFTTLYREKAWQHDESASGRGSTLAHTVAIRRELPGLLRRLEAKSLLDAACGDFNWLSRVEFEGMTYLGLDIVPDLIAANRQSYGNNKRRFKAADITSARIPKTDAILCRDCFIHLSFADIDLALANFKRSRSRLFLLTTHRSVVKNADIPSGDWRSLNFQLSPFNFPEPLAVILEDAELGKYLGIWRLKDL